MQRYRLNTFLVFTYLLSFAFFPGNTRTLSIASHPVYIPVRGIPVEKESCRKFPDCHNQSLRCLLRRLSERGEFLVCLPYWLAITFRWRLYVGGCCWRCCWPRWPRIRSSTHASTSAVHGTPAPRRSRESASTSRNSSFSPAVAGSRFTVSSVSAWPRVMARRISSSSTAAMPVARSGRRSSSITVVPATT